VPKVLAAAEAAGRPAPVLTARVRVRLDEASGEGYAMRGTPQQAAAEVRAFADAGATMLVLAFGVTDPAGVVAAAERFAREVAPLV
jgi:alkanesulfonate monooxygenase SsuD/methylene tetrahydromethanopterin reductase-like flavin-dependent oxidoreductase (luciferase family)